MTDDPTFSREQSGRRSWHALGAFAVSIVAVTATACGGNAGVHQPSAPADSSGKQVVATRWWSNSAVRVGSTIESGHADAAVAKLRPSRSDYCRMVEQTVSAGKSLLSGTTAKDPKLINTMTAFVSELQRVAPAEVASDWQLIGTVMTALIRAGGAAPKTPVANGAAIEKAAADVAADAKSKCHVDLAGGTS